MADIRISGVIMAHPRRAEAALRLRDQHPEIGLRIVYDPDPDAPASALRTSALAWSAIEGVATHHLVVQDDVRLCDDFPRQLRAAVATRPADPLFLYTDWGTRCSHLLRLAALRGASWAEAIDPWAPAQAMVLPRELARGFVDHVAAHPEPAADALAMVAYLRHRGTMAYVSAPNLVEHGAAPSLLGHDVPMGPRLTTCFGHPPGTAAPWSAAALAGLPVVPDLLCGRSFCWTRVGDGWVDSRTHEWLVRRGLSFFEMVSRFREALAEAPAADACRDLMADTLVFQFWLSGFMYGAIMATWPEADEAWLEAALRRPLAVRSLQTLPHGGLREILAEPHLSSAGAALLPLVHVAMRHGLRANAGHGIVPAPAGHQP
jgi:hypothetical protein